MKKVLLLVFSIICILSFSQNVFANDDFLFFDDFVNDTTDGYVSDGPSAVWNVDSETLTITGSSWKKYQKLFAGDTSQSGKIVIEYGIVSMTADKGFNFSVKCNDVWKNAKTDIKNVSNGVLYAVLDKDAGTYAIYDSAGNVKSAADTATSDSPIQGIGIAMTTNAVIEIDYIKVYELSENPIIINNSATELAKFDVVLNLPIINGINVGDYISIENGVIASVVPKDLINHTYTVTLTDDMGFKESNTLYLTDIPLVDGSTVSGQCSFNARDKRMNIETSYQGDYLSEGTKKVSVSIINEFDSYEDAVFVVALYETDGSIILDTYDITTQTTLNPIEESITIDSVDENTYLELYVVNNIDDMKLLSDKTVYTIDGKEVKEPIENEEDITTSLTYSLDASENSGNFTVQLNDSVGDCDVFLKVYDEGNELIYLAHGTTMENEKTFLVKFPVNDDAKTYTVHWGYNPIGNEAVSYPFEFLFYPESYINSCFEMLSSIELKEPDEYTTEEIDKFVDFAEFFGFSMKNFTTSEIQKILTSTIALRIENEGFVNKDDAFENVKIAKFLVVDRVINAERFITDFHRDYQFNAEAYSLFNSFLTDDMKNAVVSDIKTSSILDIGDVRKAMNESVIFNGLEKSTHYMQARRIFGDMVEVILPDSEDWAKYTSDSFDEEKKQFVDNGLVGFNNRSLETLRAIFGSLIVEADKLGADDEEENNAPSSSPSSNKGSIGGTFSNDYEPTKKEETKPDENQNEEETVNIVSFKDMQGYDWASEAVTSLAKDGIISGRNEEEFCPADLIVRKELAKIVALAFDLETEDKILPFSDVDKSDWSSEYIVAVFYNGIITGTSADEFMPDGKVTREMLATVIYRILSKSNIEISEYSLTYSDCEDISEYAKDAVCALTSIGVVNGKGDNRFAPKDTCTRAEAATMIYRALSILKGE